MTSNYHYPIDLNEDQNHQPFFCTLRSQASSSSSSSSLSYIPFFNPPQDHGGYNNYQGDHQDFQPQEETKMFVSNGGSCDLTTQKSETRLKLTIRKKEERNDQNQMACENSASSIKWMPSKMRLMKKMMNKPMNNSERSHSDKDQKQRSPSPPDDHILNGNTYNSHNGIIRVCSDCNTTKTPLWRSGPRGPKSLCNACGIRQRKARRAAMAAAAAAGGGGTTDVPPLTMKKTKKVQNKNKKSSHNGDFAPQVKKKCKIMSTSQSQNPSSSSNKLCFDDLTIILSKSSAFQQVFPQDEKEAAILLMALSYGMIHG